MNKPTGYVIGLAITLTIVMYSSYNAGLNNTQNPDVQTPTQTKKEQVTKAPKQAGEQTKQESQDIIIPISDISTTVKKYSLKDGSQEIKYLAVLGSDGKARVAFDACEVCGGRKGYSQRGTDVVCNNCGRVFKIDDLGVKNTGGGCWPAYLAFDKKDGNIIIKKEDIKRGRALF